MERAIRYYAKAHLKVQDCKKATEENFRLAV